MTAVSSTTHDGQRDERCAASTTGRCACSSTTSASGESAQALAPAGDDRAALHDFTCCTHASGQHRVEADTGKTKTVRSSPCAGGGRNVSGVSLPSPRQRGNASSYRPPGATLVWIPVPERAGGR